jgi:hypothetical protein
VPETVVPLKTGRSALELLAACRMLRRHLGMPVDVNGLAADGLVLAAAPDPEGFARLRLYRTEDVLAWYREVSKGPTESSATLTEAMAEHSHLLRPF